MKLQTLGYIAPLTILASALLIAKPANAAFINGSVVATSGGVVNLTTQGTLDWTHYGLLGGGDSSNGNPVKDNIGTIIGTLSSNVPIKGYSGSLNTYTWSNGDVVTSGTNANGIYINDATGPSTPGVLNLTLAASTSEQIAQFYVSAASGIPTSFTVALNDGSGETYSTGAISGNDIITIDYAANSLSTLTMTYSSSALNFGGGPNYVALDAVTVTVPETSSLFLAAMGLVALAVPCVRRMRMGRIPGLI